MRFGKMRKEVLLEEAFPYWEGIGGKRGPVGSIYGIYIDFPCGRTLKDYCHPCSFEDLITSVAKISYQDQINLFPNPASDYIHLTWDLRSRFRLLKLNTLNGLEVMRKDISQNEDELQVSIYFLSNGLYILELVDEQGRRWSEKIIVIK